MTPFLFTQLYGLNRDVQRFTSDSGSFISDVQRFISDSITFNKNTAAL